jgi:RNA polymerase sigma-70 factor, ECF subfamily
VLNRPPLVSAAYPLRRERQSKNWHADENCFRAGYLGIMIEISPVMQQNEVTELLQAWRAGDEHALHDLTPLVYAELHRLARSYMNRERPDHILQTTALVHEAYTRLIDAPRANWQDRSHFFAVCATLMRHVLVDHARSHGCLKRGGGFRLVPLEEAAGAAHDEAIDVFALDEALTSLAAIDPRKSQVVEMRFFGGLTIEETAEALHTTPECVIRDWKIAKLWLLRELNSETRRGS